MLKEKSLIVRNAKACGSILCSNSSRGYSSAIVVKCPSKIRICKEDVQTNVHY